MATETVIQGKKPAKPDRSTRRARRARARVATGGLGRRFLHHLLRKLVLFTVLVALGGWAILAIFGQRWHAPEWVRTRIETRIEQTLGDMQIEFGNVSVVINKGWRPRVRLRDVVLLDASGQLVAQLGEAEAALAMRPLLRGQLQPKKIVLNGALATLRRDRDGKVALSVGGGATPVRRAEGLPQLIEEWDQLFLKPQLAALKSIEIDGISLQYEDAQKGRAWTLDGGSFRLERRKDQLDISAAFSLLSGRDYASRIEMSYASKIGDKSAEFGMSVEDIAAQDIAAQNVALAWLDALRAPISGALRGGIEADGSLAPFSATLQIGAGVLQPTDRTRPVAFSGAKSYFTYTPESQLLRFDEVSMSSGWGSFRGQGSAWLGGVVGGNPNDLTGQFTLTGISLNPNGIYPAPLVLDGAAADFRLELNPFRLSLGQMHVSDGDSNLLVTGTLDAASDGWHLALDGRMDRLQSDRLVALWPKPAAPKPRLWVATNLLGGSARDLSFSLRAKPGQKPVIHAGFSFDGATIRFLKTMPPITGAAGLATLSDNRFVFTATTGEVVADLGGAVDVAGTSFIIPDVTIKKAVPGIVRFEGQGPVTAVLSLLNRKPLEILKETPLPVDVSEGVAKVSGTLSLPLKDRVQIDEMAFHFNGTVGDVKTEKLVPGYSITARQMQIAGDQSYVRLSGNGRIGALPFTAVWQRRIGPGAPKESRLTGQVELSQLAVDTFGIGLPKGSVFGKGSGQFTVDLAPGKSPRMSLRSDLAGVGLRLAPVNWRKSAKSTGTLEMDGVFAERTRIDRLLIKAPGLSATGKVTNRLGGGLEKASFSSVRIGKWLNAPVEMIGRGNAAPAIRITGGTFDMRYTDFGTSSGGAGGGQTGPLQVSLNRLQVTDTISLQGFTGKFSTNGGLSGTYSGKVNGQTPVSGTLIPKGDRSSVLVESNDAGGVFRSAGLLTKGRGGSFRMSLVPVAEQPGQYDGTVEVRNTRIKGAPAIAALLNAISLVGLINELAGQGIQFVKAEAKFRLGPSKLVLYKSSAVGPSIGLSMDGFYDVPTGVLDMQGVISPIYLLNGIGSVLTRKGEGLIGFSYKLRGTADEPDVTVNPLSGLAPGLLREVFRKAPPKPEADGDKPRQPKVGGSSRGGQSGER